MGWWSSFTFVGKQNTKVTVITGYRCVQSNGDGSTWNQEKIFMRDRQGKSNPNPWQQFIRDLASFVKEKQWQHHDIILCNTKVTVITGYLCVRSNGDGSAWNKEKIFMRDCQGKPWQQFIWDLTRFVKEKQWQNHDIILCMDANEVIGEDSAGLSKLIWDCWLTDLLDILDLNSDEQLKDTFWWGSNRCIDYMLGSQWVRDCILWCGALEYNDGIISDHIVVST
jgi:hypothetical protein